MELFTILKNLVCVKKTQEQSLTDDSSDDEFYYDFRFYFLRFLKNKTVVPEENSVEEQYCEFG